MRIEKFNYNDIEELFANTYAIIDDDNNVLIVDPTVNNDSVVNFLNSHGLSLKGILLTHGHFDHIRGVNALLNKFNVPIYIHEEDANYLKDVRLNLSYEDIEPTVITKEPFLSKNGDTLNILKGDEIKVIHTPFHTKGSVCYYFVNHKWLFSGDTLFKQSVGRDDLPGSIPSKMYESLEKIKQLPKETKVYPGHGYNTVLETEFKTNHFLLKR